MSDLIKKLIVFIQIHQFMNEEMLIIMELMIVIGNMHNLIFQQRQILHSVFLVRMKITIVYLLQDATLPVRMIQLLLVAEKQMFRVQTRRRNG